MRRRLCCLAALVVSTALVLAAAGAAYPGLTAGLAAQARYGTWEEGRNVWSYVSYLLTFLQKLTWDPETGKYDFRRTPDTGLDDFESGRLAFHRGQLDRAVILLDRNLARHGESEEGLFWLALALMRQAEAESCLTNLIGSHVHGAMDEPALYCSLPLLRTHDRKDMSQRAVRVLDRLTERYGSGASGRLYRWLRDFSLLTLGERPPAGPESRFLDLFYGREAERRRAANADLRFVDRARELGVESFGTGRGVAVEDFDGDGDLDLVTTGSFGGLRYFRNEGGRRFVDATQGSGLEAIRQPLTVSAADYDNDGRMDLFVVCPYDHFHLFANRGNGRFEDVTPASGLLDAIPPGSIATSWISTWGDVDNDGDLDLFVTSWAFQVPWVTGLPAKPRIDSKLFLNEGGHFRDATAEFGLAGLVHDRHLIGAAFGDFDGDGWLDLYLTGPLPGTSVLLRNLGGRRFAPSDRLDWHEPGFTAAFVDVNHDGRLDIFHGGFSDARTAVTQAVFGEHRGDFHSGRNAILLQGPDGRFTPHPDFFDGNDMPMGSMGASFGDLDNDGCLDFYLGTGDPEPWFILPNLMYRGEENDGQCSGRMKNVSMLNGFGNVQKGHGIVFFDFDGDGDQDVYSSLGGMWPADSWLSELFVNEGANTNAWIKIRLRGRQSNRFGVGSRLTVEARTADGRKIVRTYLMDGKTGFGSAPLLAHVGMGRAVEVTGVRVVWQGSGCVHTYPARLRELNVLDEQECLAAATGSSSGRRALR